MSYEQKYLKYKQKYLSLKKRLSQSAQKGGANLDLMMIDQLTETPVERQRGGDNRVGPVDFTKDPAYMHTVKSDIVHDTFNNQGESYPSGITHNPRVVPSDKPESLDALNKLANGGETAQEQVAAPPVEQPPADKSGVAAIETSPENAAPAMPETVKSAIPAAPAVVTKPKMKVVIEKTATMAPAAVDTKTADPAEVKSDPSAVTDPDMVGKTETEVGDNSQNNDMEAAMKGAMEGAMESTKEGANEGAMEGAKEGAKEGAMEGAKDGAMDGKADADTLMNLGELGDTPVPPSNDNNGAPTENNVEAKTDANANANEAANTDSANTDSAESSSADSNVSTEATQAGGDQYDTSDISEYFLKGGRGKKKNKKICDSTPSSSDLSSSSSEVTMSSSDICSSEFDL